MQKIPLTVAGAEKLKAELQQLKSVARPEVIAAIAEARSHGDLSENAEYEAAKDRQGFIEGRIAELESKLSHAQIIDPKEIHAEGKIVFGATVTVSDLETDEEATYQIVGDDEADIKIGKISVNRPRHDWQRRRRRCRSAGPQRRARIRYFERAIHLTAHTRPSPCLPARAFGIFRLPI